VERDVSTLGNGELVEVTLILGDSVGLFDSKPAEGSALVGENEGKDVGNAEGDFVGVPVVGEYEGSALLGTEDGGEEARSIDGVREGELEGNVDEEVDGNAEGDLDGDAVMDEFDGSEVLGSDDGIADSLTTEGLSVGMEVILESESGVAVGANVIGIQEALSSPSCVLSQQSATSQAAWLSAYM